MRPRPLAEIRRRYVIEARALPSELEQQLREDPRSGARAILAAVERRRRAHRSEGQRLRWICRIERELWARGVGRVTGIDEAGMSPLAGPVAAAAVTVPPGFRLPGVDDSKKLDAAERERLAPLIREQVLDWAVAFADPGEIDEINIYWAGLLAMRRAVEALRSAPDFLLIDARRLELAIPQQKVVKGDQKCISIAAASILAKTARDAVMVELDARFPGYGFARHKGYPTRAHRTALAKLGPCAAHRKTFVVGAQREGESACTSSGMS